MLSTVPAVETVAGVANDEVTGEEIGAETDVENGVEIGAVIFDAREAVVNMTVCGYSGQPRGYQEPSDVSERQSARHTPDASAGPCCRCGNCTSQEKTPSALCPWNEILTASSLGTTRCEYQAFGALVENLAARICGVERHDVHHASGPSRSQPASTLTPVQSWLGLGNDSCCGFATTVVSVWNGH